MRRILLATVSLVISATISFAQALVINSPTQGAQLNGCNPYFVSFSGTSIPYYVAIDYSLNNGITWISAINTGYVTNTTSYNWNVPNVNSSNLILRVKDYVGTTSATVGGLVVTANPNPIPFSITSPIYSGSALSYSGGSNVNIQWNNTLTQCIPYVKLEVSTNGGSSWFISTSSTPNTGSFSVNLPNIPTDKALIRVSNVFDPASFDISDEFSIVSSNGSKYFSITSPFGGDIVQSACSTKTITLATSGYPNFSGFYGSVDLSTNSGASWISLTGSLYFNVSLNNNSSVASGAVNLPNINTSNARIRVKDNSTLFTATSLSDFTIQQLPLSISNLFPVGGTVLYQGKAPSFSWTSPNICIPTVRLEYSTNGGSSWVQFVNTTNFNSYSSWTVPSTIPSGNFWVKVSDASNPQVSVTNAYVVSPKFINISSPTSTTVFAGCSSKSIVWTHGGSSYNYFNIDYTTNSGTNWASISSFNLQNNSPATYTWSVPNINSSTVQLRISDYYNPSFFATTTSFSVTASPALLSGAYTNTTSYSVGNTAYLYWTNSGCTSSTTPVDISISRDGGSSFTPIVSGINTSGTNGFYTWIVTGPSGATNILKVSNSANPLIFSTTSSFTIVNKSLAITSPTASTSINGCGSFNVTWTHTGFTSYYFNLDYTTNGGSTWNSIVNGTYYSTSPSSYSWTVPNINSSNVQVRVSDYYNTSFFATTPGFTISTITGTISNAYIGSSSYSIGQQAYLYWTNTSCANPVNISISRDNGATYSTIATNVANNGYYYWTVTGPAGSTNIFKVTNALNNSNQITSPVFAIPTPSLGITNPTSGGQASCIALSVTITASGLTGNYVGLDFSSNGGTSWTNLTNGIYMSGTSASYSWTPTFAQTGPALLRAYPTTTPTLSSTSAAFVLKAPPANIVITTPSTVTSWAAGAGQYIYWSGVSPCDQYVKIDYSVDNGNTWTNIISNVYNSNSYYWTVPNSSITYPLSKLRVTGLTTSTFGTNINTFTIAGSNSGSIIFSSPTSTTSVNACQTNPISVFATLPNINTQYNLQYSSDNGATWSPNLYSVNTSGSLSYSWSPIGPATSSARFKIYSFGISSSVGISQPFTVLASNATFTGVSPTSLGTTYNNGASAFLSWTSVKGCNAKVKLEYSTDGGTTWKVIADRIKDLGYYYWTVPADPSINCFIRISNADNAGISNLSKQFTIAAPPHSIVVTSPTSASTFIGCSNQYVYWNSTAVGYVKIELSVDNGSSWTSLTDYQQNSSPYYFAVPNITTNVARLKVTDLSTGSVFGLSQPFTISTVSSSITITTPTSNTFWINGSSQIIYWNTSSSCNVSNVKVEYSLDNGSSWNLITDNKTNNGSLNWVVPNGVYSSNSVIRISDNSTGLVTSTSPAFTIGQPNIQILKPVGGDILYTGSNTIYWKGNGTSQYSIIELTTNGGTSWTTLSSGVYCNASTCSASVTLNSLSNTAQIRVKDNSATYIEAISGVFSVLSPRIKVLKPNGGENLMSGTSQTISFIGNGQLYFGNYGYAILEISTNAGATWGQVVGGTFVQYFNSSTTNFPWTVPNTVTNNALIRIRDYYTTATQSDTSDAVFSIISPQTFTTLPLSGTNYCQGGLINVAATSSGTFLSGNVFTVQLSNSAGSFASPITIGTLTSTGALTGLIPCTLPGSLTASAFYKVRVVASNPSITATDNGQNISIYNTCVSQPSITAGTVLCGATALSGTLGYSTPSLGGLGAGNIVSVQLSDYSGNFANSTVIGTLSSTSTSGTVPFTIPAGLPSGSGYALRLTLSNPVAVGVPSNSFTINSVCIFPTVVGSSFCANSPITINFNVIGNVSPNNVYTAKLYNGSSYYLNLGTLTSSGNGLLSMTVPTTNLYTGSGWRIAISASNPNTTDVFSVNTFSILSSCLNALSLSNTTPCAGSSLAVRFTSNITFSGSNIFTAEISNNNFSTVAVIGTVLGNGIGTTTINGIVPGLPTASNYQVRVRASDFSTISPIYSGLTVSQLCIGVPTVSGSNCVGSNVSLTVPVTGVTGVNNYYYIMYYNSAYTYLGTVLSQSSTATGLLNFNFSMPSAGGYYYQMAASDGVYNINNPTLTSPIFNVGNCINTPLLTLNSNCAGSGIKATFTTNTTFSGTNTFTLEISSVTSFASSLFVGSVPGLGIGTSTILGTIPSVLANGNYYLRVKASDNNAVSPTPSVQYITQVCFGTPTATGSNCYGSPITLTVPVSGSVNSSNTYSVQYYTSGGAYQGIISTQNSTTTGLVNFTFSVPGTGSFYFIATSSNPNASSAASNIYSVSNCIATPIVASTYCPGSSVVIPFSTTQTFNSGNIFIAELVNTSLSTIDFLGSVAGIGGTVPATTVTGILPSVLTSSSNYQIRIRAILPQALSQLSSSIIINQACIGTPTVSGALCFGNVLDIYVPVSGIVNSGNSYNVNLYNSSNVYLGSYSSLSSSATGLISLQLPTTVLGVGTNYKVGVVATNPSTVGTPSLSSIFSISQCISTPTTPASGQCAGSSFPIVFTTTNTFSGSNTFVAELGVNGNYSNPVVIGSIIGSGGTIPATTIAGLLPNTVSGSTLYSIRVRATSPNAIGYTTGNFNINQLCISQPSLASSYSYDSPGVVTITVGGTANAGNVFTVELSNINSNSFASTPLVLGSLTTSSFGVINIPIIIPGSGAGNYVIRVKASSPSSTSITNSPFFAITGKAIFQPNIPTSAICAGSQLAVSIPVGIDPNATFNNGNIFIAELSNGSGSFSSPVVVGSVAGIVNSTISGFIPAGTPAGTQYRIRIRSTDFPTISDISTGALTINPLCIIGGSISGIACYGAPIQIPFTVFGQANAANVYTASLYDNFGASFGVIGTLTSTSVGQLQISGAVPGSLNTSRTYRFGITASDPSTTLVPDSYTNLFPVVGNCIQTPNVVISTICTGTPLAINVPVNVVTAFNPGNQFTLELSNSAGNFAASTILGSVLATGNTTISGIVPANLPTGSNYQIRVKANNWNSTSDPSNGFTINQLCLTPASITGPFCNQLPTSLSFNVTGVTNSATVYSVELYEYYWNFNAYINVSRGIIGTITTASVGNISVPVNFPSVGYSGSQFRVVFRSSNPLSTADYSNFFTINGNCINSPVVTGANNGCSATPLPVNISFTSPATFTNGNIFIAELSNTSGVFTNPLVIGSVAGLVGTSITGILPANLPSGNYSVRVRSTSWLSTSPGSSFFSTNALCITNTVGGIYCKGQPMTVNFSVNGAVGGGNTYTVQLSDRFGNFGSPTTLGTYNTSVGGDLNLTATVPSSLVAGNGYRVRVVASNPASVGYDNGQNIVINDYCISAPTVASYYCVGTPVNLTLPVIATSSFSPGNLFVAELSDASGNFANSSIIGFVSATTSTSLAATIPANLPSGTQYQIRIRSNVFPIIGQATSGITIDQICISTNSIAGTFCNNNNDQILIGFDVVGQTNASTTYTAQLIRNGFGTIYTLGSVTSGATSGLFITSTLTNVLPAGSYTARVVSTVPIATGTQNGNITIVGTCSIGTPSALPTLCTANSVSGTLFVNAGVGVYTSGNLFVAELSDENGSFASPLTIGGVNSLVSTYLNYLIPADLTTGNNYSIRIKSTTGTPAPSNPSSPFTINKACLATGSIPNSTPYCAGDGLDVTASVSGSINGGNIYTAQISDASGSFANPINIGSLTSGSAGLVNVPSVIPIGTPDGYGYRVRVIGSNSGSTSIANGAISIRQVCVTTSSISQTTYCTGTQITVPFLANATANPGNHFILELSDANGNFTNGFGGFIGTQLNDIPGVVASSVSGMVPFGLPNGTLYKVRIRATNPSTVGVTSPDPLIIDNTYRWIGGNTTTGTAIEWKNPNNWSCGFVPTSGNDAIIPSSTVGGNFPEINDLAAVARTLYIQNGATVTNLPAGKLTLYGSFVLDGSLVSDPSAPVSFAGTSVQSITGIGSLSFGKISINNLSSGVRTYIPFAVKGDFENNGYFDAYGNTITFSGSTAQNVTGNQLTTFFGLQLANSSGVNLLNDIYVKGNFNNSGTFNGNGKLTLFNGAPVQTISASAGSFTNFYDIQFGNFGNPAGVYINDNINVLGNFTRVLGNFTCSPSATIFFIGNTVPQVVNAGGVNITFNDINITNPYGVTLSTGTSFSLVGDFINTGKFYSPFTSNIVTFGGNGAQSLGGGGLYSFSNLVINPSAVVTFNSNISLSADFTVNGTLNPNGSTVTFNNDGFQFVNSPSPVTFSNIEIVPTSSVFPLTSLNFDGSVTNSGAYFASPTAPGFSVIGTGVQFVGGPGVFNLVDLTNTNSVGGVTFNSTFDVDGNIVNNGTFLSGPLATVTFSGLTVQSISGISPVNFNDVLVANSSSVTVLNDLNVQGDFFNNNAVVSTVGFAMVDNTVSFNGSGVQFLGGLEPTFFSSVSFDNAAGVNVVTSASVGGVSFINDGVLNCTSGTSFSFASFAPQTIGGSGVINFADVVFANTDPTTGVQLSSGVNVAGDFINVNGFNANGNSIVFNGFAQDINTNSAQENPTFATISVTGTSVVTLNDSINSKGDFLIGGAFIANDQPVTFNGSVLQTIDGTQPIQFADVTFGNSNGFAVNQTASVTSVSFDSGILTIEPGNVFAVTSTSTSAVDRQSGYVAGPIARAVEQPVGQFLFPVGTSTDYRGALVDFTNSAGLSGGILVTHQELATPTFTGLFTGAIPTTTPNVFMDSDGTAYTKVYTPVWTITPSTSINGANYAVTFDANTAQIFGASDSINANNVSDLRVVKRPDAGGPWQFLGNNGQATITGGVLSISRTDLVSFSQFAIAGSCSNVTRSSSILSISLVGSDTLEASQTALSYRWYKDGEQISNTQKKIKAVLPGDYSVQANLSGCFTNSSAKYTFTPSAIISNLGHTKIRLFPNPTNGDFTIEFTDVNKDAYQVKLINAIGVEVWDAVLSPTDEKFWKTEVELSDISSGVYFVKISQGKNVVIEKLVIQK